MKITAPFYYVRSLFTILFEFKQPFDAVLLIFQKKQAHDTLLTIKRDNLRFWVKTFMDAWVIKETCIDEDYTAYWKSISPNWAVIDVGSAFGDFAVMIAKKCPQGIVHAYEPLPAFFSLLQKNISENNIQNAIAFPQPIASKKTFIKLSENAETKERVSAQFVESDTQDSQQAVSLAEAISRLPNGKCDLLKMDCEGFEFEIILNSSIETLQNIERIAMETHEFSANNQVHILVSHLQKCGFEVETKSNPVHHELGFLFAHKRIALP